MNDRLVLRGLICGSIVGALAGVVQLVIMAVVVLSMPEAKGLLFAPGPLELVIMLIVSTLYIAQWAVPGGALGAIVGCFLSRRQQVTMDDEQ